MDVTPFYGDSPCRDRVRLVEDNVEALDLRIQMIASAKEEIILSTFDFHADESGSDVAAMLYDAAQRGVRVRILVDGAMAQVHMAGEAVFDALGSHENVEIRIYNPVSLAKPGTINGRLHDKYLIVDGTAYLLGGRNTYDYFLGDYPTKHPSCDRELLVYRTPEGEGESSLDTLMAYHERVWSGGDAVPFRDDPALAERSRVQQAAQSLEERRTSIAASKPERFLPIDYSALTQSANAVTLLSNPIGTQMKQPQIMTALAALMQSAQERVVIHSPYAVCNDTMYAMLAGTAQRVPSVTLLVNSVENGDNLCASSDYLRHRGDVLATGVDLYEYDGGKSYHGKSILIDDRLSVVGSWNLDMRSAYLDTELMLVVDSEALNQELEGHMQTFEAESRHVTGADTYELPQGVTVAEMGLGKRAVLWLLRLGSGPVRCLL